MERLLLNSLKTVIKVVFLSLPGVMIITLLRVHSMAGLNRDDYNQIYDEDLGFCESIMEAVMQQCIYENEINQRAIACRKAAQMQEAEQAVENAADAGDMKEEQNGTIMQGM